MKLEAISNIKVNRQNKNNKTVNNNNLNNNNKVTFTGFADSATAFWNFVDKGGRGLQFTVEDMFGTNFPRSIKGAMSGYKYTGKINVSAFAQEVIREFLTGPIMTAAPIAIIHLATKATGKTANTHRKNIVNLSYLAEQLDKNQASPEIFEKNFIIKAVEDMLAQSTGKIANKKDIDTLSEGILEYSKLGKIAKTKAQKKEAKNVLANLQETFETIVKSNCDNYKGIDFKAAKYSTYNGKVGSTKFDAYVDFINAFIEDYIKTNKTKDNVIDLAEKNIDNFKKNWVGKRILTIVSMLGITGMILSLVPKLYTFASGKDNPNGKAIYAEAQKRGDNK